MVGIEVVKQIFHVYSCQSNKKSIGMCHILFQMSWKKYKYIMKIMRKTQNNAVNCIRMATLTNKIELNVHCTKLYWKINLFHFICNHSQQGSTNNEFNKLLCIGWALCNPGKSFCSRGFFSISHNDLFLLFCDLSIK